MPFQPFSEKEASAGNCVQPGVYDFEVLDAEDTVSKSGNDMIALRLSLFVGQGRVQVRDWLLATKRWAYKVRHFAETCNLLDTYDEGEFCARACVGKCGRVQVIIEESEEYGSQNRVKDYGEPKQRQKAVKHEDAVGSERGQKAVQKLNPDDIPF